MTVRSHRARDTSADHNLQQLQQLKQQRPNYASVRVLTSSFKKICLTCDFTASGEISKGSSDAFIGETLADHCQDIAFPASERIADAAAGLRDAVTRRAGIPLRKQTSHKR